MPDFESELAFTTKFRTASFYYDFHLMTIFDYIKKKKTGLNISVMLRHLLNAYKQPPSQATNFVKQKKVRIGNCLSSLDQGYLVRYFFDNCKIYGFEKAQIAPETFAIYRENKANETETKRVELPNTNKFFISDED